MIEFSPTSSQPRISVRNLRRVDFETVWPGVVKYTSTNMGELPAKWISRRNF